MPNISLKTWEERDKNHHFEVLFFTIGQEDSLGNLIYYLVFPSNEKLVLNVDKVFGFADDVDIGLVN